MRVFKLIWRVGLVIVICCAPLRVYAESETSAPALSFRELKITNDEAIVIQANQDITHLNAYWLGYVSSDAATPPPVQQLPDVPLLAGQAILLTDAASIELCGVRYEVNLGPSLSDSAGSLALWHMTDSSFTKLTGPQTAVNWAKSTKTTPIDMSKQAIDLYLESSLSLTSAAWYFDGNKTLAWQPANVTLGCRLTVPGATAGAEPITKVEWSKNAVEPVAIIEAGVVEGSSDSAQPNVNIGLAPPLITELLPNPTGTGTDATDEFIELYNSNDAPFTLAGFKLQTGLNTTHSWVVPAGITIPPKGYRAFYASESGLTMSNTSGQATLFDTTGAQVAQSDPYDSAPDGQAWALANGAWYWTTKPTPGTTNDIATPIVKAATAAKKVTASTTATKGAATKAPAKSATTKTAASTTSGGQTPPSSAPIHPLVLAGVALAAIGYGVYEYRHDLANAFHKLRRNRDSRR